ncbi:MAG: hypothetical protein ACHP9Z_16055 [Streptosporangiales bacterium]
MPDFERTLFRRCLYRRVRPFHRILSWCHRDYFSADFELVRQAGAARSLREFDVEATHFGLHHRNLGFLRRVLRLRLSAGRLRSIFRRELAAVRLRVPVAAYNSTGAGRRPPLPRTN